MILHKRATALINPRKPNSKITRFSFPSKNMEYLSSGTPMIGYKLDGIPSEYYDYFYTIDDSSEKSLRNTIVKRSLFASRSIRRKGVCGASIY